MTGSSYIPIVVPIVAFFAMAFWLGLVFYADGHPGHRHLKARPWHGDVAAAMDAGEPAGPGEHERIDEHSSGALLG